MPHNPESFADLVVMTVKAAMAPVLERIAAAEQQTKEFQARLAEMTSLRDRVTVVETKAAVPPQPADMSPVLERIAGLELRHSDDLAHVGKAVSAVSERIAVLETRAPVPGPAGADGKDGADGLGFDDLDVEFDGDRTVLLKVARGSRVKSWPIVLPFMRQQGVYQEGHTYTTGDVVTWGGSQWHCEAETTTKPGDGSKAWTLVVKRGRDGKDGRDAPGVPPVVSIGRK